MRNFLYRFKYRYGKYLPLSKPVDITLELCSYCNMQCKYCYHAKPRELPFIRGVMAFDVAKRILKQGAELAVPGLKLNWRGESTMHPRFRDIAEYAEELSQDYPGAFIERISNSNFYFPNDASDIFAGLAYQTKVKVSFDSFRKDIFDEQRPHGNHALILANINKFYHWPGRNNELVIQAIRTTANMDEDIELEVARRWPSATISIRDVVDGRGGHNVVELQTKRRAHGMRRSCEQAFARLIFSHTGRAYMCCPDIKGKKPIGDITRGDSLSEIWNSPYALTHRNMIRNRSAFNYEPCKSCSSFESFAGYKPGWNS